MLAEIFGLIEARCPVASARARLSTTGGPTGASSAARLMSARGTPARCASNSSSCLASTGGTLCRTTIRHSTRVRDAHAAHLAVGQAYLEHPVSQDYRDLAHELIIRARLDTDAMAGSDDCPAC
jgi:hypothetical protein